MTRDWLLNWDRDTALAVAPRLAWLHPNWITTASLVLALVGLGFIAQGADWTSAMTGAVLIFASRWIDWIDGHVARATGRATNLGGLYDIAVGYVTMVLVMVAIGLRQGDTALAWTGAGAAVLLRLALMGVGWGLARRQRLDIVPWNPQKLLTPRQRPAMRRVKWTLDVCRNDYWIVLFAVAGGAGLQAWAWAYTGVVAVLILWLAAATLRYLRRVSPAAPKHDDDHSPSEAGTC
ncbi:CDP-alcohol phosphatidyltransferase family protein [Thalassospiraceae bacterium LMO-SO8]|nr:CDP-alcohol phosphatidyltransferase family protein [Alphaproteobacteria bacterium LMO-S08]WND77826.1 CDP-alcohol phosphatidyltransferase family protein [Thalassospiraceae bacterium LMO-SO8]